MIQTKATDKYPIIQWEISPEILDKDPEERSVSKLAIGCDIDSDIYHGTAEYSCGELIGIRDIERI